MKKICILLALLFGFFHTSFAQSYSDYEDFFVERGGATIAKYAHPKEAFRHATVVDVSSRYVDVVIDFNWTSSKYRISKTSTGFFTNISVLTEGSLVSSFSNCDEPSLSVLDSDFLNQYCQMVGESRSNLSKIQKICAVLSYQFAVFLY